MKKIDPEKQENFKANIEAMVRAMTKGYLRLNEDKSFTHVLKFPTEGEASITELNYKPRLKIRTIHQQLQGVKTGDADGRILAFVAALTSKPKGLIQALDTEDYEIAQAIAIFFL